MKSKVKSVKKTQATKIANLAVRADKAGTVKGGTPGPYSRFITNNSGN